MQSKLSRYFLIATLSCASALWFSGRLLQQTSQAAKPNCAALTFDAVALPAGTVNQPYSATLESGGGVGPYQFSLLAGTLPNGVTLNPNGTFSGTPTQLGTFNLTVQTQDTNGCSGAQDFNLTIQCQTITVTAPARNTGVVNSPFSAQFTQTGGIGTTLFTTESPLPDGIKLLGGGNLTGTASRTGVFPLVITATDSNGCTGMVNYTLTIVGCPTQFTVNSLNDTPDAAPGNAICADANGQCTLRAALLEANLATGCSPLTINFSVTGTLNLAEALPALNHPNLTINGPGAKLLTFARLAVPARFRHFFINGSGAANISGLTLTGGDDDNGGAVRNEGTLSLSNVVITGNTVFENGGAIRNGGTLLLRDATLTGNSATGAFNEGGGLYNQGTATVVNVTIAGNAANSGGGLLTTPGSTLTLVNATITGNTAAVGSGGLGNTGGTAFVRNTIVAANANNTTLPDVAGAFTSLGANLLGNVGTATGFNAAGDQAGTGATPLEPRLAPLSDYGGPTPTCALLPGSPALNTGQNCVLTNNCVSNNLGFNLPNDQRGAGFNRQSGSAVDVGAFESRGFTLAVVSGNNQSAPPTAQFGAPLVVSASSAFNEPVAGGVVTFTAPLAGPSAALTGTPALLAVNGQTSVAATANALTGSYQIQAVSTGATPVNFSLSNQCPALTFTVASTPVSCPGAQNGSLTINAAGGLGTLEYSINGGQSFQPSNVFPNLAAGAYQLAVRGSALCPVVTGAGTVAQPAPLAITPGSLPAATAGLPYTQSFSVTGGTGTKTLNLSGTLPNGLTFSQGSLGGTPLQTGTFAFTLTAVDQNGCQTAQAYNLQVNCPSFSFAPATLPNAQLETFYSQALSVAPAGGNYLLTLAAGQLPPGLQLNGNVLSGTPTAAGVFSFTLRATGWGACTGQMVYTLNVLATCPALTLNPTALPSGTVGTAYATQSLSVTGGSGPFSFAVTAGVLPQGLTLTSGGSLSGTPTASGTFNFSVTATAASGCTASRSYTVVIGCPALSWTPASLPNAQAGVAYNQTVTASGATSYNVVTGNLPPGLTLNASTGQISGTATVTGVFNFTVQATAAGGCTGTQPYSLSVGCPTVTVNPASLPSGTAGTAYNQSLGATPSGNYSFAVTAGALPSGLSLSAAGVLSGTPSVSGSFLFTVTATGSGTCSGARQYTLTINAACTAITLPALPATGTVGKSYVGSLATTTPSGTYTFSVDSGALPPGLTIDNLFAQVAGKPTTAGSYNFTLKATRGNGCTGMRAYTVVISSALAARALAGDYNGDGQSDLTLWSAGNGRWQILRGSEEQTTQSTWGGAGDVTLLGDYDADGQTDLAVFRPANGTWYIQRSSDGTALVKVWGGSTDIPVPGDYDGDGQTDLAIFRSTEGNWYILPSSDGNYVIKTWGLGVAPYLDVPVPGDYDGDGKTDLAVFRRQTGTWLIRRSSDGQSVVKTWGAATDLPVLGDYDGDGKTDLAVWRGATGEWFVLRSSDQQYEVTVWGAAAAGDVPAPGDYDGDGQTDCAIWRAPEGQWYVRQSRDQSWRRVPLGKTGDAPVPSTLRGVR